MRVSDERLVDMLWLDENGGVPAMDDVVSALCELQRVRAAVEIKGRSFRAAFNEGWNAAMDAVRRAMESE